MLPSPGDSDVRQGRTSAPAACCLADCGAQRSLRAVCDCLIRPFPPSSLPPLDGRPTDTMAWGRNTNASLSFVCGYAIKHRPVCHHHHPNWPLVITMIHCSYTHARTPARTPARPPARTHARTHTHRISVFNGRNNRTTRARACVRACVRVCVCVGGGVRCVSA